MAPSVGNTSSPRFYLAKNQSFPKIYLEKIFAEIAVADLTEAGVKPPKAPSQERKRVDKTKYCRFHKCHGYVTDDCIHLKNSIELLIQRGRLKQFVKNPESERKTVELIADGKEADKIFAMSVERLGDFPGNVEISPTHALGNSSLPPTSSREEC